MATIPRDPRRPKPQDVDPSRLLPGLSSTLHSATLGADDVATAYAQTVAEAVPGKYDDEQFKTAFANNFNALKQWRTEQEQAHPGTGTVGAIAGGAASTLVPGGDIGVVGKALEATGAAKALNGLAAGAKNFVTPIAQGAQNLAKRIPGVGDWAAGAVNAIANHSVPTIKGVLHSGDAAGTQQAVRNTNDNITDLNSLGDTSGDILGGYLEGDAAGMLPGAIAAPWKIGKAAAVAGAIKGGANAVADKSAQEGVQLLMNLEANKPVSSSDMEALKKLIGSRADSLKVANKADTVDNAIGKAGSVIGSNTLAGGAAGALNQAVNYGTTPASGAITNPESGAITNAPSNGQYVNPDWFPADAQKENPSPTSQSTQGYVNPDWFSGVQ